MDVYAAISDPVRRAILDTLRQRPLPAGDLAARFPISRPAVSRHLRVLRESGLVTSTSDGRQRVYRLDPGPLAEIERWLGTFRDPWASRLDALATEVHRTRRQRERQEDRNEAYDDLPLSEEHAS